MNAVYKSRVFLVKFAKSFPFILCFIVCFSHIESLFALTTNSLYNLNGNFILYKPISWLIGRLYLFDWYSLLLATILSLSMETCWYNKAAIIYLFINILERNYFTSIELYKEYIYAISIANIIISGFFVYKGIKIILKH